MGISLVGYPGYVQYDPTVLSYQIRGWMHVVCYITTATIRVIFLGNLCGLSNIQALQLDLRCTLQVVYREYYYECTCTPHVQHVIILCVFV